MDFAKNLQAKKGKVSIKKQPTGAPHGLSKKEGKKLLAEEKEKLYALQERLFADGSHALLVVIQAMDAAGKDSLTEHVFSGVNPQGCEVTSFKVPSARDYAHDFLWRHYAALPEKGKIGIFNRSHYESVLTCKVHPEFNLNEKVWTSTKEIDAEFWANRYESIRNFEKHLTQNGTKIVKLFLNVSKDTQKQRFLDRINQPEKNWKFGMGDVTERGHWSDYMTAYEQAINETSTDYAPWHIVPADQKWFARAASLQIIIKALEDLNPSFPKLSEADEAKLADMKTHLEQEA